MNLKRNITFQLKSRKKDEVLVTENVPIRMRVVFDGKRIEFTTGYRIDAAKWDASKQRVKNGCTNKLKQTSSEIPTQWTPAAHTSNPAKATESPSVIGGFSTFHHLTALCFSTYSIVRSKKITNFAI